MRSRPSGSSPPLLGLALALYLVPGLTPVGPIVGVLVGLVTLALPVLAVGLAYSLVVDPVGDDPRLERTLGIGAVGLLVLFVVGFLVVIAGGETVRVVGDVSYLAGIVVLLGVLVAVPGSIEPVDRHWVDGIEGQPGLLPRRRNGSPGSRSQDL